MYVCLNHLLEYIVIKFRVSLIPLKKYKIVFYYIVTILITL